MRVYIDKEKIIDIFYFLSLNFEPMTIGVSLLNQNLSSAKRDTAQHTPSGEI